MHIDGRRIIDAAGARSYTTLDGDGSGDQVRLEVLDSVGVLVIVDVGVFDREIEGDSEIVRVIDIDLEKEVLAD